MTVKLNEFLKELKELQDKYSMYIKAEYEESWEEDCNGDMYLYEVCPYLSVYSEETGTEHIIRDDI